MKINGVKRKPSVPCRHCGAMCHKSVISGKYVHDTTYQRYCFSDEKGWLSTKAEKKPRFAVVIPR